MSHLRKLDGRLEKVSHGIVMSETTTLDCRCNKCSKSQPLMDSGSSKPRESRKLSTIAHYTQTKRGHGTPTSRCYMMSSYCYFPGGDTSLRISSCKNGLLGYMDSA